VSRQKNKPSKIELGATLIESQDESIQLDLNYLLEGNSQGTIIDEPLSKREALLYVIKNGFEVSEGESVEGDLKKTANKFSMTLQRHPEKIKAFGIVAESNGDRKNRIYRKAF
jgi:hypothetical protein